MFSGSSEVGVTPPSRDAASADRWAALAIESYRDAYVRRPDTHPVTLSAFRADTTIADRFAQLVAALRALGPEARDWVDHARRNALSFDRRDSYDIADFVIRLRTEAERRESGSVVHAANALLRAYDAARVAETHLGPGVAGATGLSIWIPSTRAELAVTGDTYRRLRWEQHVGWRAFLAQ